MNQRIYMIVGAGLFTVQLITPQGEIMTKLAKKNKVSLDIYRKKRSFDATPEPAGKVVKKRSAKSFRFVVQKHAASHLHYDFRLEMDGVLKSWAIPKGPSKTQKRLAIMVEDHPVSYIDFAGEIPEGNYGAGTVEIWDSGTYAAPFASTAKEAENYFLNGIREGKFEFTLQGKRLTGTWALVKFKEAKNDWLLMKVKNKKSSTAEN